MNLSDFADEREVFHVPVLVHVYAGRHSVRDVQRGYWLISVVNLSNLLVCCRYRSHKLDIFDPIIEHQSTNRACRDTVTGVDIQRFTA